MVVPQSSAGTDSSGDDGLGDLAQLDGLDDTVLDTTNLTEQDDHLATGIGLVENEPSIFP
jgi:hypothetical protein